MSFKEANMYPEQAVEKRSALKSYLDFYLETSEKTAALPTLRELESDYIGYLLEATRHNITQVSRILAISRTALYNKIQKLNLSDEN
ncbi:MAG: helix-turn-helix domain-containing protein [Candidatus Aminicenantales bacterium]